MNKLIGVLFLAGTFAFAQTPPTQPKPEQPAQTQAAPQQKESIALIKAKLKAYRLQQKQSYRLAKAQTQVAIEQYKLQQVTKQTSLLIAVENTKANAEK